MAVDWTLALFGAIRREAPDLPVGRSLTAHGTIPEAVDATRRGVFGFLTKPFDSRCCSTRCADALRLSGAPHGEGEEWRAGHHHAFAGDGKPARRRRARVAATDATASASTGASGTGKGIACARDPSLQAGASPRRSSLSTAARFRKACSRSNCSDTRKGAFTGATQDRRGLFQAAEGGTLFLDEVGDMPLALQVKLLRAIEERAIRRSARTQRSRSTCASSRRPAPQRSRSGSPPANFARTCTYRLNVVRLVILPALAERREDIPLLAGHFRQPPGRALRPRTDRAFAGGDRSARRRALAGQRAPTAERDRAVGRALARAT